MVGKLSLYNGALRVLGERALASLTESRESRRALDEAYDSTLAFCLEQGQWNFAIRSIEAIPTPNIAPAFGYANAFTKPEDWVRTVGLTTDDLFRVPLLEYTDERGYWYADQDVIYVRYVSNSIDYGMDLSRWPASFQRYVELSLANDVCERLTQNASKKESLERDLRRAAVNARNKDAMNEASIRPPPGSWITARWAGGNGRRYDRA
jgi:hypothetical protein